MTIYIVNTEVYLDIFNKLNIIKWNKASYGQYVYFNHICI